MSRTIRKLDGTVVYSDEPTPEGTPTISAPLDLEALCLAIEDLPDEATVVRFALTENEIEIYWAESLNGPWTLQDMSGS